MLRASDKFRCESAIEPVLKGKRTLLPFEAQDGRAGESSLHDLLVLFWLKAACAVNECALLL